MKEIVFEDGLISLNSQEVPSILRSLSVEGKVRFDEHKVDGMSGKKKMPVGYEDCDISASLYLCTDDASDCYDKLETLAQMFRDTDPNANPQIYEVSSRHIGLRGIRQVVFSRLSTSENDKSDEIVATLGFVEHRPPMYRIRICATGILWRFAMLAAVLWRNEMAEESLLKTLKRAIELAMPDLRGYYRVTRKAKVVASYPSDGKYYADVQPLRNNETDDENEPVVPHVEIPVMWGGPKRGIVCPPAVGTLCDLTYYDGDPNYPRISNFRWQENAAPDCGLEELIIQKNPDVSIRIDKENNITLKAPQIILQGMVTMRGSSGGKGSIIENADRTQVGNIHITGNVTCEGHIHATHISSDY